MADKNPEDIFYDEVCKTFGMPPSSESEPHKLERSNKGINYPIALNFDVEIDNAELKLPSKMLKQLARERSQVAIMAAYKSVDELRKQFR